MTTVQQSYSINPDIGYPGQIAEPNSPTRIEVGVLHVDSAATRANPRPGDAVFYNNGENAWQVPITAADQLAVGGILTYRADTVAATNNFLQFSDGAEIFVCTVGVVWVIAGGASERGDNLVMQTDDWKWDVAARVTTVAAMHEMPIQNVSRTAVVDTGLVKAAIGYGRAI